jgi:dTMP kinase
MNKGKLIVFEGSSDGIGKSTQIKLLWDRLEKEGNVVVSHHFPTYGTYHGAPVEEYLRGNLGSINDLSPYFINSLYATDRACAWYTKLKPMYEDGNILLMDRYTTSSLIYQSAKIKDIEEKKKFLDYVTDFEYNKLGIQRPDVVVFLTAPFEMISEMRKNRIDNDGIVNDLHERDLEYLKEVYENSMFVAEYLGWDIIYNNNGMELRSREDIHNDVYSLVKKKTKR